MEKNMPSIRWMIPILTLFAMMTSGCLARSNELLVSHEFEASSVHLNEEISVVASVLNVSAQPILVNSRMNPNHEDAPAIVRDITFSISAPDGNKLIFQPKVHVRDIQDEDFVWLEPAEQISQTYDLSDYYEFSQVGTYRIQVTYENVIVPENMESVWVGVIESDTVEFVITDE